MTDSPTGSSRQAGPEGLRRADLAGDWLTQFHRWFQAARADPAVVQADAMVLATASPEGVPSARTVLLKQVDEAGLVFYTNLTSRKGRQLADNPRASVVFPWLAQQRQVLIDGRVEPVPRAQTEAYARSRPRGSQVGAWVSHQSEPIEGRQVLEARLARRQARWPAPGPVPVPPFWGGLRVVPDAVEFWQGRPDRLHDRLRYRRDSAGGWTVERLAP